MTDRTLDLTTWVCLACEKPDCVLVTHNRNDPRSAVRGACIMHDGYRTDWKDIRVREVADLEVHSTILGKYLCEGCSDGPCYLYPRRGFGHGVVNAVMKGRCIIPGNQGSDRADWKEAITDRNRRNGVWFPEVDKYTCTLPIDDDDEDDDDD